MKANELRIGNILNYFIEEEGKYYPTVIDWQDLRELTENPNEFNESHKPIELTEDVFNSISYVSSVHLYDDLERFVIMFEDGDCPFELKNYPFLHQLQNLYFALTGEELEINF